MPTTTAPVTSQRPLAARSTPRRRWRRVDWPGYLLLLPAAALAAFAFVAPMLVFLQFSFFTFRDGKLYEIYSTAAYREFLTSPYYHEVVWQTLKLSALTAALAIVLGYPLAYAMWRVRNSGVRIALAVLVFMPLTVSVVVRSYGWQTLLGDTGPVNYVLRTAHLTDDSVQLVFNSVGVVVAMVHIFLPFAVFPIYTSLTRVDPSVLEAAADLGATWRTTLLRITMPLTLPGVVAGAQLSLTLALGAFVTPSMLGGGRVNVLPLTIYNDTTSINWPMAAVGGVALLILSLLSVWLLQRVVALRMAGAR